MMEEKIPLNNKVFHKSEFRNLTFKVILSLEVRKLFNCFKIVWRSQNWVDPLTTTKCAHFIPFCPLCSLTQNIFKLFITLQGNHSKGLSLDVAHNKHKVVSTSRNFIEWPFQRSYHIWQLPVYHVSYPQLGELQYPCWKFTTLVSQFLALINKLRVLTEQKKWS